MTERYVILTDKGRLLSEGGRWRTLAYFGRGADRPRFYATQRGAEQAARIWTSKERPNITVQPWKQEERASV